MIYMRKINLINERIIVNMRKHLYANNHIHTWVCMPCISPNYNSSLSLMPLILPPIQFLVISQHTQEFLHFIFLIGLALHGVQRDPWTFIEVLDLELAHKMVQLTRLVNLLQVQVQKDQLWVRCLWGLGVRLFVGRIFVNGFDQQFGLLVVLRIWW